MHCEDRIVFEVTVMTLVIKSWRISVLVTNKEIKIQIQVKQGLQPYIP